MAINSLTQMIVPPPKYNVDRLVPCRTKASTRVENLFLIERGPEQISNVSAEEVVEELMINTADAYGFPPFQYLAPAIVLGEGDYSELQRRERKVLTSAMAHMPVRRLASDSFGWADTIPALLAERNFVVDTAPVAGAPHAAPARPHPRLSPVVARSADQAAT
jgi:hypothetical protein